MNEHEWEKQQKFQDDWTTIHWGAVQCIHITYKHTRTSTLESTTSTQGHSSCFLYVLRFFLCIACVHKWPYKHIFVVIASKTHKWLLLLLSGYACETNHIVGVVYSFYSCACKMYTISDVHVHTKYRCYEWQFITCIFYLLMPSYYFNMFQAVRKTANVLAMRFDAHRYRCGIAIGADATVVIKFSIWFNIWHVFMMPKQRSAENILVYMQFTRWYWHWCRHLPHAHMFIFTLKFVVGLPLFSSSAAIRIACFVCCCRSVL